MEEKVTSITYISGEIWITYDTHRCHPLMCVEENEYMMFLNVSLAIEGIKGDLYIEDILKIKDLLNACLK